MKLVRLGNEILAEELARLQPYMDELRLADAAIDAGPAGGGRFDGGGIELFGPGGDAVEGEVIIEKAPQISAAQRRRLRSDRDWASPTADRKSVV